MFGLLCCCAGAWAQDGWDTTGNGLLNGPFFFREILLLHDAAQPGRLKSAVAQYGTITFDGAGNYNLAATVVNSSTSGVAPANLAGTYAIGASGHGFLRRPDASGGFVFGSFANGVFIGSATEDGYATLMVATPARATAPVFSSAYTLVSMDLTGTDLSQARDATLQLAPDGAGGLARIDASGYIGGNRSALQQSITGARYSFNGGIGQLNLPGLVTGSALVSSAPKEFYLSPGGDFLFGGSTTGFDFFVGVRTPALTVAANALSGTYFHGGVDVYRGGSAPQIDAYYGAFAAAGGSLIGHQRIFEPATGAFDYLYRDTYSIAGNGTHEDMFGYGFQATSGGEFRVGFGRGDFLGIAAGVRAPEFTGPGPFINPLGVLNAASFSPVTAGIAPGTVVNLYGTGFGDATLVDATFPPTLGGDTVLVDGSPAPVYVVSPNRISFVMPYGVSNIAGVQVRRNGVTGNRVTVFVNRTSPGIFTIPSNGIGLAAALHADFTLVSEQNPARPGETVQVYLTGLGAVSPAVAAGTPGPVDPLSRTTQELNVFVGGVEAAVLYSGLAPQLGGLYQMNVTVPENVGAGDLPIEIRGPDTFAGQARLPVR